MFFILLIKGSVFADKVELDPKMVVTVDKTQKDRGFDQLPNQEFGNGKISRREFLNDNDIQVDLDEVFS